MWGSQTSHNVDAVYVVMPDGGVTVWDAIPNQSGSYQSGSYISPPGVDATLCSQGAVGCPLQPLGKTQSQPSYVLTFHSGEHWYFDNQGQFLADADPNNNQITYTRDPKVPTAVTQATDTHGRTFTYSYGANGYVSGVTDNAGSRGVSYTQNSSGQLTGYKDAAGNSTGYSYDSNGNLTQITDPAGEVTNISHASSSCSNSPPGYASCVAITRVTSQDGSTGDTTTYAYYPPSTPGLPECTPPTPPLGETPLATYGETVRIDPNGNQTTYCYDTHDRVFETFDDPAFGDHAEFTYDLDDNIVQSEDPALNTSTAQYDDCERLTATIAPKALPGTSTIAATLTNGYDGTGCGSNETPPSSAKDWQPNNSTPPAGDPALNHTIGYQYDTNGNLQTETLPLTGSPSIATTHNDGNQCTSPATCYGLMVSSQDADGNGDGVHHLTSYQYYTSGNNAGDLKTVTPPSGLGATSYSYDADSRVTSATDGKGQTTTFQYDNLDRVTQETHKKADGTVESTVSYTYDKDGNLLTQDDSTSGTSTYSYDLKNRLTNETSPGVTNGYTYDGADNLKTVTDGGGTVTYGYDKDNRVISVQEPGTGNPTTSFRYDADGRRICTTYPNGVVVQNLYDNASNLLSTKAAQPVPGVGSPSCSPLDPTGTPSGGAVFSSYTYKYTTPDGVDTGLRLSLTIASNGGTPQTYSYSYDGLNRLTEWSGGDLPRALIYSYDAAGNVTSMDKLTRGSGGVTVTTTQYTYNQANQITNTGYTYDQNGNMQSRSDGTNLGYNARDQTTSIGGQTLGYLGDGQGKPTQVGNAPQGGTAPTLANNQLGISSQASAANQGDTPSVTYYTRDPDGTLLGERTPNGNYYYVIEDGNGSVIALTDNAGTVADTYTYDPWGSCTSSSCPTTNSFGFDGGLLGQGGLYHFSGRYYDPSTGAWTQQDPVVHLMDPTQCDPYVFSSDDPVNATDPSGTDVAADEVVTLTPVRGGRGIHCQVNFGHWPHRSGNEISWHVTWLCEGLDVTAKSDLILYIGNFPVANNPERETGSEGDFNVRFGPCSSVVATSLFQGKGVIRFSKLGYTTAVAQGAGVVRRLPC
jgi:RHS repeat-associated protein